ncbi:MAG: DUF2927 domain-containing protein [Pedobacter sp.]|nr:DUF2927 domain-containing protein [Pedobacter sp.]MDQ8053203.1 DUF2927 domain-containing protein [Pedobacter sp.]
MQKIKLTLLLLIWCSCAFSQQLTAEEKIIFNEVAFTRKQVGEYELVHKWIIPIRYKVYGDADAFVLKTIDSTFAQIKRLTKLDISRTDDDAEVNYIFVVGKDEKERARLSKGFEKYVNSYGATLFRSNKASEIVKAETLLMSEKYNDRAAAKSAIVKNIVKSLGFFKRTKLISSSLFYEQNNGIQKISTFDSHIIAMLYHSLIRPGMDKDQVREILAGL